MASGSEAGKAPRGRRWGLALLPLVVFLLLGGFLLKGLYLDSRKIPSALIGQPVPEFSLPPLPGRAPGLASADLKGEVSLVNVFASWCVTCRAEHPLLMHLKQEGVVPIHGLDHKDDPAAALGWLKRFGDPYTRVGADRDGRVSIDWGVYGVPESFVVDARGRIVCKQIGAIDERVWKQRLLPAIEAARAGKPAAC